MTTQEIMEGVTVLHQRELTTMKGAYLAISIISLILAVTLWAIMCVGYYSQWNDFITLAIGVAGVISIIVFAYCILSKNGNVATGKYEYQVTISDNVPFNEFNNKYKIIDNEDGVYTIREK